MSALPELPRFVGCATCGEEPYYTAEQMREYARAAVAAEREACAAVCARLYGAPLAPDDGKHVEGWQDALDIAESRIRARGDA